MNPAQISRQQPARTTLGTEVGDGSYTVAPPGSDTVKKKKKKGAQVGRAGEKEEMGQNGYTRPR
jgi:hypothetical protein